MCIRRLILISMSSLRRQGSSPGGILLLDEIIGQRGVTPVL
jgi:hypothetical protein